MNDSTSHRAWRLVPRHNPDVNKYWMCDEGRFGYHELHQPRLVGPVVDGLPAPWDGAVKRAAALLADALLEPGTVGVVLSAQHTNEDNFVLQRLAAALKVTRLYVSGKAPRPERADAVLRAADVDRV